MQPEHIHNFQQRLNQWVANQGFWFQIRHSVIGGGFCEKIMFHLFRMISRLAILLLLLLVGSWIYLTKWTNSQKFKTTLENSLRSSLSVTDLAISPSRSQSHLEISRLGAEGGPNTFFSSLEARNIRCRMRLTDGLLGTWKPGSISIAQLDVDLRAGTDDAASATNMARVLFSSSPTTQINTFNIANANLRWGYSARTQGSITSSHLKIQRVPSGWRLSLKGGSFQQNWLQDFDIIQMTVLCEPDGLFFEEALLRKEKATLDLSGLHIEAGERPMVRGSARIKNLDLDAVLPAAYGAILNGSISSVVKISGSINSTDGLTYTGKASMNDNNAISLRDSIHILKALSVVDYSRNYHRVDLKNGSFHFKSAAGGLHVYDINLHAQDLLDIKGEISVSLPSEADVHTAIQNGLFADSSDFLDSATHSTRLQDNNYSKLTLKPTANQTKQPNSSTSPPEGMDLFDRLGHKLEMRKLESEATARMSRMLRHKGEITLFLPANTFERAPNLRRKYPVDLVSGRVPVPVPINGYLEEITLEQSKSVYEDGQR